MYLKHYRILFCVHIFYINVIIQNFMQVFFSIVWFWYILLSYVLLYVVIIHFNCFMEFRQMNTPYYNLCIHSVHSHLGCFSFFIITNQILQWTSVHACFLVHTWKSFSWLKLHEYFMWQPGWEGSLGENGYMYMGG